MKALVAAFTGWEMFVEYFDIGSFLIGKIGYK